MTQQTTKKQLQIEYAKPSSKGQIVIPNKIRKQLKIDESSVFAVAAKNDTIVLKKIDPHSIDAKDLKTIKLLEEAWKDIESGRYKIRSKESFFKELANW
jgi:AbrB family looped-hinge helix DNA binding protein